MQICSECGVLEEVVLMLWVSLVMSSLLLVLVCAIGNKPGRLLLAGGVAVLGVFLCIPGAFLSPVHSASAAAIALAAFACAALGRSPRFFQISALAAMVLCYLGYSVVAIWSLSEQHKLLERHPFESMADRLGYEARRVQQPGGAAQEAPSSMPGAGPSDSPESHELTDLSREVDQRNSARTWAFEMLHKHSVAVFIDSPGFGVARGMRPSARWIDIPEADPVPLLPPPYEPDGQVPDSASGGATPEAPPTKSALRDFHLSSVVDFVNVKGFGYVQDREHVRGFQSHQFHETPSLAPPDRGKDRWQVCNLQLLSLLKHDEPRAYMSEHLPRMSELREAKTRPLDDFEREALTVLQRGESLKAEFSKNRIRMLGSIRAVRQCLDCHGVAYGDLLGAFSYDLRKVPLAP